MFKIWNGSICSITIWWYNLMFPSDSLGLLIWPRMAGNLHTMESALGALAAKLKPRCESKILSLVVKWGESWWIARWITNALHVHCSCEFSRCDAYDWPWRPRESDVVAPPLGLLSVSRKVITPWSTSAGLITACELRVWRSLTVINSVHKKTKTFALYHVYIMYIMCFH